MLCSVFFFLLSFIHFRQIESSSIFFSFFKKGNSFLVFYISSPPPFFNCPFREIPPTPPDSLVYQLRQHGTHLMNDTLMGGLYQEFQTSNEKKKEDIWLFAPLS